MGVLCYHLAEGISTGSASLFFFSKNLYHSSQSIHLFYWKWNFPMTLMSVCRLVDWSVGLSVFLSVVLPSFPYLVITVVLQKYCNQLSCFVIKAEIFVDTDWKAQYKLWIFMTWYNSTIPLPIAISHSKVISFPSTPRKKKLLFLKPKSIKDLTMR